MYDLLFAPYFLPVMFSPVRNEFTCPNDRRMALCIKLHGDTRIQLSDMNKTGKIVLMIIVFAFVLKDDDCEEGEIKDTSGRRPFTRYVCRFYLRGHCTWGPNCRFVHPGVNDKGLYLP